MTESKHWQIVVDLGGANQSPQTATAVPEQETAPKFKPVPMPNQIIELAKQSIFYQDEAVKALSVVLYYHLKAREHYELARVSQFGENYEKYDTPADASSVPFPVPVVADTNQAPIFITGKTGGGKTHLVKEMCRLLEVNHLIINATHLSNSGHKGMTLADVGEMLMNGVHQDAQKAMFSVIFFDEFDKLFLSNDSQLGVYHQALATELLTLIEGTTDFPVRDSESISSRHMLFILGGSFTLHQDKSVSMGFVHDDKQESIPTSQLGLTQLGLPDELAGRIGQIISMVPLTNQMLQDILLSSPTSPYTTLKNRLAMVQCTVEISDALLELLLHKQQTAIDKFGVRGVYQGFNELPQVLDILMDAPSYPYYHYMIDVAGFTKTPHQP